MTLVKEMDVEELREIIRKAVRETMEDILEDMLALSSKKFLDSIAEARKDYAEGRVKKLEEILDV